MLISIQSLDFVIIIGKMHCAFVQDLTPQNLQKLLQLYFVFIPYFELLVEVEDLSTLT